MKKSSVRSRGSSSSTASDPRKKVRECCRKFVAFMCTQVGVGALIVAYAVIGAVSFMSIEGSEPNPTVESIKQLRKNCSYNLWVITDDLNNFDHNEWRRKTNLVIKQYMHDFSTEMKKGSDLQPSKEAWSTLAALMYCLSVFTMIGYGNMVPRTPWGKGFTMIYATFGIPLYILYFLNMGKILAKTFKFLYTTIHECSRENRRSDIEEGSVMPTKKVIVPSTACLWVMTFYILAGSIMFAYWEDWTYLNSVYFCVTSLCKIGIGDFVPGTKHKDDGAQIKLAINFFYILLGMGLVAMCYNLMKEEVKVKMKEVKEDLKLCLEDLRGRFTECCGNTFDNDDY